MYAIFERFTEEARRAAAQQTYQRSPKGYQLTSDGYCPLGVCLKQDGHKTLADPGPSVVARELAYRDDPLWQVVYDEAGDFIRDWDHYVVISSNLTEAVGLV